MKNKIRHFEKILERKKEIYGNNERAIELAIEEYTKDVELLYNDTKTTIKLVTRIIETVKRVWKRVAKLFGK